MHTPYRPQEAKDDRALPAKYQEVLIEMDKQIGRLLKELPSNTLTILCGDNGPEPSFDKIRTGGLRGMKWSLYEGGIRTPLIVSWPGTVPAGTVNDSTVVSSVDFMPTLCSLAGIKPATSGSDGEDMSAVFKGEKRPRQKPLLWEYGRKPGEAGKVKGGFPYPKEPGSKSPNLAIRDGDWKLLINADGTQPELYNLAQDQNETVNRRTEEPEITARLKKAVLDWRASLP